jgi:methionyl-tRNA formyltransferase
MKFVFFGSPLFARIVLEELVGAGLKPAALVCNPDRPVGRKKIFTAPDTKQYALAQLPQTIILQPENPADALFLDELRNIQADIFIVAAYGKILKPTLLEIPVLGTVGVHPSFLPRLRGASPIQTAILEGSPEIGVVLYAIDEGMDHGPVYSSSAPTPVDGKTFPQLLIELAHIGGRLAVQTLPDIENGSLQPTPQDHSQATITKKFVTEDGFIPYPDLKNAMQEKSEASLQIERKIRALGYEPGCFTISPDDKRIKLIAAKLVDGKLEITQWQMDGMHKPSSLPFSF